MSSNSAQGASPLSIGDLVPDVELIDHTGEPWRFRDHLGRPIVVILHRHLA